MSLRTFRDYFIYLPFNSSSSLVRLHSVFDQPRSTERLPWFVCNLVGMSVYHLSNDSRKSMLTYPFAITLLATRTRGRNPNIMVSVMLMSTCFWVTNSSGVNQKNHHCRHRSRLLPVLRQCD